MLRVLLLLQTARGQVVIQELADLYSETERGVEPKNKKVLRLFPWSEIVGRRTLSKSKSKLVSLKEEDCVHDLIAQRANATTFWFTCLKCGTRWPRAPNESLDVKTMP